MADSGWTYKEIGEALLLDHETISRHVREYKEYNKLSVNSGGSDPKLSFAQSKELINHLEKSRYLKVSDIYIYTQLISNYRADTFKIVINPVSGAF